MNLTGDCNRCGLCCTVGNGQCVHLEVTGKLGEPGATRCLAYANRYDGMPIFGRTPNGLVRGWCRKDSPAETAVIVQWIGKGCSLKRKN